MSKRAAIRNGDVSRDCGMDFIAFFAVHERLHSRQNGVFFIKIKYEFDNGEVTEVGVSEEIGALIIDFRRKEESAERKHRRHCYSMDAAVFEGLEYATEDFTEAIFDDTEERNERVRAAFSHLSEIQQKRLLLLAGGMSVREIVRREGRNFRTVYDSIEAAKKKFLKFF